MKIVILIFSSLFVFANGYSQSTVPTFKEVTGHDFGDRITLHHQMMKYVETVAEKSDRAVLMKQGHSWGKRELVYLIITDPSNHSRINEIKQHAQDLADPRRTSVDRAQSIIMEQPVVFWIGGSIHGFELSGSEGVLMLIERLTTSNDPEVLHILKHTVVLADPMINPDGRDAFAHLNHENMGKSPNPSLSDWNNSFTSWQALKFRTGHYYFDTNRDWFMHSQLETRNRVNVFQEWKPQAGIDAHEMGSDVEFYFDPPTDPVGPYFPEFAANWFQRFGEAHARAFNAAGFDYMVSERYNYFYPGYTTSYLSYQGAVGMLYEQGSSRGLALERPDKSVRTLRDAAQQQFTAAFAAVSLAANERISLQADYFESLRKDINDGKNGVRRYYITNETGDPGLFKELSEMLLRNGVEIEVLKSSVTIRNGRDRYGNRITNKNIPAGSLSIDPAQPRNRFIRTMLEPTVPVPEPFLQKARERMNRGENPRFYDVTSWSLPLLFNLNAYSTAEIPRVETSKLQQGIQTDQISRSINASYAYILDGRYAASLTVFYHLKKQGYRASLIRNNTKISGVDIPSGSIVFRVGQNNEDLKDTLIALANTFQVPVILTDTGMPDPGFTALGSGDNTFLLKMPEIAIVAEDPVFALSFGFAWYTLDQLYNIPITVLKASNLNTPALSDFNVLIFPEINDSTQFKNLVGKNGIERIKKWISDGGTLITMGASTEIARGLLGLNSLESYYDEKDNVNKQRISVPGAFFKTTINKNYWLSAGVPDEFPVLVNSSRVYHSSATPPSSGKRPVITISDNKPHVSGHAWPESLERLPGSVFAMEQRIGQGRIISFSEELNFRSHWRGANRIFLNAVIVGPSGN